MKPKEVFDMREEYKSYKYVNFRTNLNNLRKVVAIDRVRMLDDCAFYGHDRLLLPEIYQENPQPPKKYPNWNQSAAREFLSQDITEGAHIGIRPAYLWIQRPEYLEFPLEVFRNHIYQEIHKRESQDFRFDKKQMRFRFKLQLEK